MGEPTDRQWNEHQVRILEDAESGTGDTVVIARAGTGKTTTMLEAARRFPAGCSVVYLAFNSRIKDEVTRKAPQGVDVRTLHSLGRGALFLVAKGQGRQLPEPDGDKVRKLIDARWTTIRGVVRAALVSAVSFAKNTLAQTLLEIETIVHRLDLDIGVDSRSPTYRDELTRFCESVQLLMELSLRSFLDRLEYDFDDMIWIPVKAGLRVKQFDRVIVDEGQDLNACQHALARMARRRGGRIILVGDDRQAIYAWRGAHERGIESFVEELGAKVLRLPVTYRCGQKIVDLARTAVSDYAAAPTNAEGRVDAAKISKMIEDVQPGDAILSRVNAPLVGTCLQLLKLGKRARVVGRDVGKQVVGLIAAAEKGGVTTVPGLMEWLGEWRKKEVERVLSKDPPGDPDPIVDRAECIEALSEGADSIGRVREKVADLFTDDPGRVEVVLSSTHKAKGLEWGTVWMLADTYRPSRSTEEQNLWYVAVTRAISRLVVVSDLARESTAASPIPAAEVLRQEKPKRTWKARSAVCHAEFEPSASSPLWAPLMPN